MPLLPLAQFLLPFLSNITLTEGPYDLPPWSNETWRTAAGLVPLLPEDAVPADKADFANASQGLRISQAALQQIKPKDRHAFSPSQLAEVDKFLDALTQRVRAALARSQLATTALKRPSNVPGWEAYQLAITKLIDRPHGVLWEVEDVLELGLSTPRHAWIGARMQNRNLREDMRKPENKIVVPPPKAFVNSKELKVQVAIRVFGAETVCSYSEAADNGMARTLRAASREFVKWRDYAVITGEADDAPFKAEEKKLQDLVASQGARTRGTRSNGGKGNLSLASSEDQSIALHYYEDVYLSAINKLAAGEILDMLTQHASQDHDHQIDLAGSGNDLGVGRYATIGRSLLWAMMGLPGAEQFPFANPGNLGAVPLGEQPASRIVPHTHQVSGVCIMLGRIYTRLLGDLPLSSLLCDDVGLGKTFQITGLISVIVHLYEEQSKGTPLPPFAIENNTLYFAGLERIPNLPCLILVPHTLVCQWHSQIKLATHHGAFTILPYSSGQGFRQKFFARGGAWDKAMGPEGRDARRTIVLADFSAIASEARTYLVARGDPPKLMPGVDPKSTIFGKKFLVMAIDECHQLRNVSGFYMGALRLSANSVVQVGATATPIYTGPFDVPAQGRLLRVPEMIGEAGEELCIAMEAAERERNEQWNQNSQEILASMRAELSPSTDCMSATGSSVSVKHLNKDQIFQYESVYVAQGSIDLARKALEGVILRRTRESKDPEGNPVLPLRPYIYIIAYSELSPGEFQVTLEIENAHANEEDLGGSEMRLTNWSNFLITHKHALMHMLIYELMKKEKEIPDGAGTLTSRMTDDWTAENIYSKISTRMLTLDKVVTHYWPGGVKPAIYKIDGSRDPVAEAQFADFETSADPPKIVIFIIYKLHRDLVKKLFDIQGRRYVEYHGDLDQKERDRVVEQFETDDEIRILIISNVGGTGLNLTAACIVIFMSGVWSGQERRQILGRLWRFGQKRQVIVIEIQAPNSINTVLAAYANRKTMMSDNFLSREKQIVAALSTSKDDDELDADDSPLQAEGFEEDEDTADDTRVLVSKAPKRRRKDEEGPLPATNPASSKRARKANDTPKPPAQRKRKATALPGPPSKKVKPLAEPAPPARQDQTETVSDESSGVTFTCSSHNPGSSQGCAKPVVGESASRVKSKGLQLTLPPSPSSRRSSTLPSTRPSALASTRPAASQPRVPAAAPSSSLPKSTSTKSKPKVPPVPSVKPHLSGGAVQPAGGSTLSPDELPRENMTPRMVRPKQKPPPSPSDHRSPSLPSAKPSTLASTRPANSPPLVPPATPPSSLPKSATTKSKPKIPSTPSPKPQFSTGAAQAAGESTLLLPDELPQNKSAQTFRPGQTLPPSFPNRRPPSTPGAEPSSLVSTHPASSQPLVPAVAPPTSLPTDASTKSKSKVPSASEPQFSFGPKLKIWDLPKEKRTPPSIRPPAVPADPGRSTPPADAQSRVGRPASLATPTPADRMPESADPDWEPSVGSSVLKAKPSTLTSTRPANSQPLVPAAVPPYFSPKDASTKSKPKVPSAPDPQFNFAPRLKIWDLSQEKRIPPSTRPTTVPAGPRPSTPPTDAQTRIGGPSNSDLTLEEVALQIEVGFYMPPKVSEPPRHLPAPTQAVLRSGTVNGALLAPPPFGQKAEAAKSTTGTSNATSSRHSGFGYGSSGAPASSSGLQARKRPIATGDFARYAASQRLLVPDSPGAKEPPSVATLSNSSMGKLPPITQPPSTSSSRNVPVGQKIRFAKPSTSQGGAPKPSAEVRRKEGLMKEKDDALERRIQSKGGIRSPSRQAVVNLPATRTHKA